MNHLNEQRKQEIEIIEGQIRVLQNQLAYLRSLVQDDYKGASKYNDIFREVNAKYISGPIA